MNTLLEIGLSNAVVASVLALVAGAAGRCCRRPAVAHGLWLLVLLKLITPPLVGIPVPWPATPDEVSAAAASRFPTFLPAEPHEVISEDAQGDPAEDAAGIVLLPDDDPVALPATGPAPPDAAAADAPPAGSCIFPWRPVVLAVWLGGSGCWFVLALVRTRRFLRLLRHARPAPARLQARAERLAERLGLAGCPGVWLVPGRISPMLWALTGRPRLLLPAGLLDQLDDEQLATLLAHELAHLRRRDHWVRALELLTTGLYWWHPVAWWAGHELREAEEQCCDAWVVWALPRSGRTYATALVDTLDFLSDARAVVPLGASGVGHVHDLKRRLTMILRGTTPRSLTWAGCLGLATLGLLLLPVLPTWAQTEEIQKEADQRLRIERLKKELEELTRAKISDKEKAEQVEKARAEVRDIMKHLEKMRAQMQEAEVNLRRAQGRLAQLEGKRETTRTQEKIIIVITDADGKTRTIEVPPGDVKRIMELKSGGDVIRRIEVRPPDAKTPPTPPTPPLTPIRPPAIIKRLEDLHVAPGAPDSRLRDLEKKIEGLMKEIESLRREMRPARPGADPRGGPAGADPEKEDVLFKRATVPPLRVEAAREAAAVDARPNPPPENVEGVIKNVDSTGLVSITLGSDSGVLKGHTLEVYRLDPSPMYLGTIRILEVRPKEAVGQPLTRPRAPIQVGDHVSSRVPPK